MPLLQSLLQKSAAVLGNHMPSGWVWSDTDRTLRIPGAQVEAAAVGALKVKGKVVAASVRLLEHSMAVDLQLVGGLRVTVHAYPVEMRLDGSLVTFVCDLPEGVQIGHRIAVFHVIIGAFDKLFGLGEMALQQVSGLRSEGTRTLWSRELPASASLTGVLRGLQWMKIIKDPQRLGMVIDRGDLLLRFRPDGHEGESLVQQSMSPDRAA